MKPRRARRWLAVFVMALLLGAVGWRWISHQPAPAAAAAPVPEAAGPAASAAPPARPASPARLLPAESPPDPGAELARRMKADWCGFGAAEHERQTQAVHDRSIAVTGTIGLQAMQELCETVSGQVLEEAQADVLRRWVSALVQRGDERSLAVADYLEGAGSGTASPGARTRLQARARSSHDPMVTALALQQRCAPGDCINIDAAQWSRLEPANLRAWLELLHDGEGRMRPTHAACVLDRVANEARESRSYQRELHALLWSLPQTASPGLVNEAEIQLMVGLVSRWPMAPMRPLLDLCRGAPLDAGTVARCEAVARLLWRQDDHLNRAFALGIARSVIAARPALRPQWEAHAREYEAVVEWAKAAPERAASQAMPEPASPCDWQPDSRRLLREFATHREWEAARTGMREAGADEAALAARWRQAEGRSALDPPRPVLPPSAPAAPR